MGHIWSFTFGKGIERRVILFETLQNLVTIPVLKLPEYYEFFSFSLSSIEGDLASILSKKDSADTKLVKKYAAFRD